MKIVNSAIQKDGVVYTGRRHSDIIIEHPYKLKNGIQGFVLEDGTFVDRVDGAKIALESGQINELNHPPLLYSEDLW